MRIDSLKKYVTLRQSLLAEKTKLESRLAAINRALGSSSAAAKAPAEKIGRKRPKFSAAARAAIAAAQRARWAKIKAAKKGGK